MNFIWQDFDRHDLNLESNKPQAETSKYQPISGKKYVPFQKNGYYLKGSERLPLLPLLYPKSDILQSEVQ